MKLKKVKAKSKILDKAKLVAEQVILNDKEYSKLSLSDLKARTDFLIDGLQKQKFYIDDIVVDAFSIAREIIFRVHKQKAFPVQIMGAFVVHSGDFAEMFTGEGKTLTILLVAFLNALTKKGVHIVTVNEYLVQRDAEFANTAFEALGITVGYNNSKMAKDVKKEMFARDITYTTNSELGFDYLRDNLVKSMDEKVIRGLDFVIIDEGDSVLIDEARTPLIISGMPKDDLSMYIECDTLVGSLNKDDYIIDNESNTISLTDSGVKKAEAFFRVDNLYSVSCSEIVHKITNALTAHFVFANGREYIVKEDKIQLVDQFTGRILEGRSYNAGLQQAIQAKERVKIEPENITMATITYQSFFRLYKKLSAVSGTAITEAEEFLKIYNMVVVQVPTNRPIIRIDKPDYIFGTKQQKWIHVIEEIKNRNQKGQPILVGTSSVADSELISNRLNELNIAHQVLNARDNSKEAEIVKLAGLPYSITISTNMAGRGTDIKVNDEVKKLGGLYVIGTERHESRRIDNQLRGRTGRQGDPGESRFFTSLEDSLFKRFATDRFEKASKKLDEEFYDSKFFSKMLDKTQRRVEGLNFDVRKNLMDYDHVLSLQRELVYKQRDQILFGNNNKSIMSNMAKDYVVNFVSHNKDSNNSALIDANKTFDFLNKNVIKFNYFNQDHFLSDTLQEAKNKIYKIIMAIFDVKWSALEQVNALGIIGEILLTNLDFKWTKHIDKMTKLREGVSLRSLEQKMPLNIYIEDGNALFESMKFEVVEAVFNAFFKLSIPNEELLIRQLLEKMDFAIKNNQIENVNFEDKIKINHIEKKVESIEEEMIIDDENPQLNHEETEHFVYEKKSNILENDNNNEIYQQELNQDYQQFNHNDTQENIYAQQQKLESNFEKDNDVAPTINQDYVEENNLSKQEEIAQEKVFVEEPKKDSYTMKDLLEDSFKYLQEYEDASSDINEDIEMTIQKEPDVNIDFLKDNNLKNDFFENKNDNKDFVNELTSNFINEDDHGYLNMRKRSNKPDGIKVSSEPWYMNTSDDSKNGIYKQDPNLNKKNNVNQKDELEIDEFSIPENDAVNLPEEFIKGSISENLVSLEDEQTKDPLFISKSIKSNDLKKDLKNLFEKDSSFKYDDFETDMFGDLLISKIVDKYEKEIITNLYNEHKNEQTGKLKSRKDFNAELIKILKRDYMVD